MVSFRDFSGQEGVVVNFPSQFKGVHVSVGRVPSQEVIACIVFDDDFQVNGGEGGMGQKFPGCGNVGPFLCC